MAARGADLAAPARRAGLTVNLPVTVKLVGRPTDEALARLVGAVETAVGRRLAEARRELPLGRPVVHPPESVAFTGDLPEGDRARLDAALRDAVLRATADLPEPRPWLSTMDTLVGEPFDPAREDVARGTYAVPSYQSEGRPSRLHEVWGVARAEVRDGPSQFEGALLVYLPGIRYIHLSSPRYVVAGALVHAEELGNAVFGTTSYAILEGPLDTAASRFWAVGTDRAITQEDLGEAERTTEIAGYPATYLSGTGRVWNTSWVVGGADVYRLIGIVPRDRDPASKGRIVVQYDAQAVKERFAQIEAERTMGAFQESPESRRLVFAGIDAGVAKVEGGDTSGLQDTAERLSRLDRAAFALVPWEMKVRYIKLLLAAWTWQEQETAIVEIFASLKSDSEVDAVVEMLREAGVFDKLFDDLDSEVYSLLTTVGERFPRERGGLTLTGFFRLLQAFGLIPDNAGGALSAAVTATTGGVVVPGSVVDDAHDAVMGFVRFGSDLGEAIGTIFAEPDKIVEGIVGLVELLVKAQLAQAGYPPAVDEMNKLVGMVGQKLLAGMRGAERLGCGEKILRRIKWRLIWEIASLFIGVGEIKAAIAVTGVSEKLAGVLRFLAILARLGEAVDAETAAIRLARLAAMLKAERAVFSTVDEVAELLARLPERDVRKLGRLLSRTEIKEGETLAELAARSKELHAVVEDAMAKAELLKSLSGKAGGLTDEIVEAFQRLADDVEAARRIVKAIPDGEGARFAAAMRRMPAGRLPEPAFLELLAASPRRMDALSRFGYESFAAVYRRAGNRAGRVDQYLDALEELERTTSPTEFRRLLDALEREDPAAWLKVESRRRALAGLKSIDDLLAVVAGSPRAQAGLDRLLRRNQSTMMRRMLDEFGSEPEVVQCLEEVSRLSERQLDGLVMLDRYARQDTFAVFGDFLQLPPAHREYLFDAIAGLRDPAAPDALVIRIGFEEAWDKALYAGAGNVQGGIGHFQTVESLLGQFPGARFDLEFPKSSAAGSREIDIVMDVAGRRVDVEVKSLAQGQDLGAYRPQILKDLRNHLGDAGGPWSDLLWRFPDPNYLAKNFARARRVFLEELDKLPLPAGMSRAQARAALDARLNAAPPWKLIDGLP